MSTTQTEQPVAERLESLQAWLEPALAGLEAENRLLRRRMRTAMMAAVILVPLVAWGVARRAEGSTAHAAATVAARRFVLADVHGVVRGVWEIGDDDISRLQMRDTDGKVRLKLTVLPDGSPGLTLADRAGHSRAVLGVLPDETNTLVFADAAGTARVILGLGADHSGTLLFADPQGNTRAGFGTSTWGDSNILLPGADESAPEPAPSPDSGMASVSSNGR